MNTTDYVYKLIDSPFGKLKLIASEKGLAAVLWEKNDPRRVRLGPLRPGSNNKFIKQAENQLKAYFSGKLRKFTVPLDFKGTDFQKSVWMALLTIPFGETTAGSRDKSAGPMPRARSAQPTAAIQFRSLPPAIACSEPMAN